MTFDPTDPAAEIKWLKAVEQAKLYEAPPPVGKLKKAPTLSDISKLKKARPRLWHPTDVDDYAPAGMPGIPLDEAVRFALIVGVLIVLAFLAEVL